MVNRLKGGISFLLENSLFLVGGALIALVWANLDFKSYHNVAHPMHFAVNDIGMAFFFLLAGKEIRESMLPGGSLSDPKIAALPIMATIGGMAGPALLYIAGAKYLNPELTRGWAIPMATDIAFSYLIAKLIFGKDENGNNTAPITFLLLLAIVDDAGGLIILAAVYPTGNTDMTLFVTFVTMAIVLSLSMFKVFGIKNFWLYLIGPGALSWYGFYKGGIHPALALVPLAWCMPHAHSDLGIWAPGESKKEDTLNKMEHWWENPVEIILGLFGFVNAGVVFSSMGDGTWLVLSGLLIGKPLGIVLLTMIGIALGLKLPTGMDKKDLLVVGFAASIGFTVALFVSVVAFKPGPLQDSVKMGALFSFAGCFITFAAAYMMGVTKKWNST